MAIPRKLVDLLREDPDDVERYGVVADQLLARGDPRGELISLELALANATADSPKHRALVRELDRFTSSNAKWLLGGLWTATSTCTFRWRFGFIREATMWTTTVALPNARGRRIPKPRANKLLRQTDELLTLDSAVLLEHLTLVTPYNSQLFLWDAAERVAQGAPASLHRLDLRDFDYQQLPDWEPMLQREIVWRKQVLTLGSDSLPLESVAELFGAS